MTTDEEQQPDSQEQENDVDPLVWHYQREKRLKLGGVVSWGHTVESKNDDHHFDINCTYGFISNACFIDVVVPSTVPPDRLTGIFEFVQNQAEDYATSAPFERKFPIKQEGFLDFESFPEHRMTTRDCKFTGRVFFYTHYLIRDDDKQKLVALYETSGLSLIIRDGKWVTEIQKFIDRPTVFLGHDSADKDGLVRELAHKMNGPEMQVWYDEISLKPGDRLRKSLDQGLEDTDYFLPVITENWMNNDRYAEYEFDAIMQKYITEKSVNIIPICVGVSPSRLKEKSRVLADFVAIVHGPDHTIDNLANQIAKAVDPQIPKIGEPLPPLEPPGKKGLYGVGMTVGPKEPVESEGKSEDSS